MTTQPTSNLQYSWSVDLKDILFRAEFTISWITITTNLLISTGTGSAESYDEGPTTVHFIEVPTHYLGNTPNEPDLIVLEITRTDHTTLAHLRPACAGAEPVRDIAMAGAGS